MSARHAAACEDEAARSDSNESMNWQSCSALRSVRDRPSRIPFTKPPSPSASTPSRVCGIFVRSRKASTRASSISSFIIMMVHHMRNIS